MEYFTGLFLALSASSMNSVQLKAAEAGMTGFITKPFNPEDFYHKIKKYSINIDKH